MNDHPSFVRELSDKIGPPVFAATLVACLLERTLDPLHIGLLVVGLGLMAFGHRRQYHRQA